MRLIALASIMLFALMRTSVKPTNWQHRRYREHAADTQETKPYQDQQRWRRQCLEPLNDGDTEREAAVPDSDWHPPPACTHNRLVRRIRPTIVCAGPMPLHER